MARSLAPENVISTGSLIIDPAGGIVTADWPAKVIGLEESAIRENVLSIRVVAGRVPVAGTFTVDSVKLAFPILAAEIDRGAVPNALVSTTRAFDPPILTWMISRKVAPPKAGTGCAARAGAVEPGGGGGGV